MVMMHRGGWWESFFINSAVVQIRLHPRQGELQLTLILFCRNNREAIDKIVEKLIVDETIRGEDFRKMLSKYTDIPESNMATPIPSSEISNVPANI